MAQPHSVPSGIPKPLPNLIDNRPDNTMLEAIRRLMGESRRLDLATGYFEVGAMVDLDPHWQSLDLKAADPAADVSEQEAEIDAIVERLYFGEVAAGGSGTEPE